MTRRTKKSYIVTFVFKSEQTVAVHDCSSKAEAIHRVKENIKVAWWDDDYLSCETIPGTRSGYRAEEIKL